MKQWTNWSAEKPFPFLLAFFWLYKYFIEYHLNLDLPRNGCQNKIKCARILLGKHPHERKWKARKSWENN